MKIIRMAPWRTKRAVKRFAVVKNDDGTTVLVRWFHTPSERTPWECQTHGAMDRPTCPHTAIVARAFAADLFGLYADADVG